VVCHFTQPGTATCRHLCVHNAMQSTGLSSRNTSNTTRPSKNRGNSVPSELRLGSSKLFDASSIVTKRQDDPVRVIFLSHPRRFRLPSALSHYSAWLCHGIVTVKPFSLPWICRDDSGMGGEAFRTSSPQSEYPHIPSISKIRTPHPTGPCISHSTLSFLNFLYEIIHPGPMTAENDLAIPSLETLSM
jgi:hypothetical protein